MPNDEDNVIAALEHPDRICHVELSITGSQLAKIATVMQESFPVLTHLSISLKDGNVPVIPGGFLGGSAPCLRKIELKGVPFPALPTLLLSVSDLVELKLHDIPPTGYISPEAMAASLAALPRLEILHIEFECAYSRPDRMLLPPVTRTVLPTLNHFFFFGVCGYLEDFAARIDAPQLDDIVIFYSDQVVHFGVPQLSEFINRSDNLKRTLSRDCQLTLYYDCVDFHIGGGTSDEAECWDRDRGISVCIICKEIDQQILHMAHVLSSISAILSNMVHFAINPESFESGILSESEDLDEVEWLQLLHPFSSVQTLSVSGRFAGHVSRALEDIAGVMVTEVLPALDLLCLEDQPVSSVDNFVAVRRDSGHPVTVVNT